MSDDAATHAQFRPEVSLFDDELARLDAVATIDALDRGDMSIEEAVNGAIDRTLKVDPLLGAVAFERYGEVRAESTRQRRGRRGAFDGVPTFVKDMVPVAGLPLTWGSAALAGGPPQRRTRGIARDMQAMGLAFLGSSKMPEWGFTPSTEFPEAEPTRNPWNPGRSVGGSSGGAAALVASGAIPVAHAADGGGSIRIPAACAGLVGLKPTRGRLRPHADEARLPVAVTVDGVVTRTVRDTARWYAEMERVYRTRTMPPVGEVVGGPSRRLRVGVLSRLPNIVEPDAPTRDTLASTAVLLADLGHHVEEVASPVNAEQFRDDFIAYFQFLVFMATRTARLTHGPHVRLGEITDFSDGMARTFSASPHRLVGAATRLRRVPAQIAEFFGTYDLLLSPVLSHLPPELGHMSTAVDYETLLGRIVPWMAWGPIANAAGTPAISLPMGFDTATHLPVAAMLSAGHGDDALLLQIAHELEHARPWPLALLR